MQLICYAYSLDGSINLQKYYHQSANVETLRLLNLKSLLYGKLVSVNKYCEI